MTKKRIIKVLLAALNSRFLNQSPCLYGFIGNVDAFSIETLRSEEKQRPGITVAQVVKEAEDFASCPMRKGDGLIVLEDGVAREADIWDVHQLKQDLFRPKQ